MEQGRGRGGSETSPWGQEWPKRKTERKKEKEAEGQEVGKAHLL